MKITKPHDSYFKNFFDQDEQAKSFLENYLPKSLSQLIDLSSLEILKDSFVDQKLKDLYSDMLCKVNIMTKPAYIYILLDHKSYSDKGVILQLLKYIIQIYEREIKRNPKWEKLPPVIPMVFYHGKTGWQTPLHFVMQIDLPDQAIKKYILDFEYILFDLSDYSDEELKGEILLRLSLFTFKHIFDDRENWEKILSKFAAILAELKTSPRVLDYLKTLLLYLLKAGDVSHKSVKKVLEETLYSKGGEAFMTAAEELQQEAKIETKNEIAKKMLIRGDDVKSIMEVTELSLNEIEILKNDLTVKQ